MVINDHPQIRMQKPFVFAVVRHPYERLVSSYLDFGQTHVMMSSILMIIIVVMIFTWTLRVKCSSLQVKNLSSCLSNIGPLYHPRITPDPIYHILMGWLWCQLSSGDVNDAHKDKYKDKYADKDKYKVLQRPNVCCIFFLKSKGFKDFKYDMDMDI